MKEGSYRDEMPIALLHQLLVRPEMFHVPDNLESDAL